MPAAELSVSLRHETAIVRVLFVETIQMAKPLNSYLALRGLVSTLRAGSGAGGPAKKNFDTGLKRERIPAFPKK